MRDIFVGTLCAIGVFLFVYRGYDARDVRAGSVAGTATIGTALMRITPPGAPVDLPGILHVAFAPTLLLALVYFSLCLFTLTADPRRMPEEKRRRNVVYRACGRTMLAAILLIVVHALLPAGAQRALRPFNPVFVLEEVAVFTFGLSWLTKGEAILADRPRPSGR